MAGVEFTNLENIESQTSFLDALNANFVEAKEAIDNKLSRVDTDSGSMNVAIDMNGKNITNVGSPVSSFDAARWIDVYSAGVFTGYAVPNILGNQSKYLRVTADGLGLYWSDSSGGLSPANNLSELTSTTQARLNLGLGTASTYDIGGSGSKVPLLSNTHTWAGAQTWQGLNTFQGGGNLTGSTEWRVQTTGASALSADSIGYRGAPQTIHDSNYVFALNDMGRGITHSSASAHAWTIPPDSDVNFPIHTVIICDNYGLGTVTITRGSGVNLTVNGSGTSADFALTQYNVRSLYKIGPNFWKVI